MRNCSRLLTLILCLLTGLTFTADLKAQTKDRRGPFNRAKRSVRSREVDAKHIRIELDLDWEKKQFRGRAIHRLSPYKPLEVITLDAEQMKILGVERIGKKDQQPRALKFQHRKGELRIELGETIAAGREITLAVDYLVTQPREGGHFVDAGSYEPNQSRSFWTKSEPEYARFWFPCVDSPADRVTSEVLVTVPEAYFVLSNGVLQGKKPVEGGRQAWHWVQVKTHVPYLISVVAGEFDEYRQKWQDLEVVSYVPKGMESHAARSFEKTTQMMEFFNERIGVRYPWSKYTQICVDEFGWGGMEHTSATTLNVRTLHDERAALDVSSDGLVAHELVHQWYGNLLTCKDWGEIWLNESFATYFTTLWYEHDKNWDEATWSRHREAKSYQDEDTKRYRRPIVTYRYPQPGRMFDRHSYPKGARVLHMLRYVLGDEAFWKSIRHYTKKHQHRVVETADLRIAVEESTGQGLNWFFDQWVHHGGHPEFDVRADWDEAEKALRLTVKQTQTVDSLTPLFRMPVEIEMVTGGKTVVRKITVAKQEQQFNFSLDRRPDRVLFDPRDWILKKLVFPKSKQEWIDQLANDANLMCRVRAIEGLKAHKGDGDVRAALVRAARQDDFWGVRQTAAEALGKFAGKAVREALIRAAREDKKSEVRRAAIRSLGNFPKQQTRDSLRAVIRSDPSYYAVAEALGALVKVDREGCRDDLLAALDVPSHREVILKAACTGLAELKDIDSRAKMLVMLKPPSPPQRRMAVMAALAKLGAGDPDVTKALAGQLDDARRSVRRSAIDALAKTGDPGAIAILLEHKSKTNSARTLSTIDAAVEQLRAGTSISTIRRRLDTLESENRRLRERLRTLEEGKE